MADTLARVPVCKAVFQIAGLGMRFLAVTTARPEELLPIPLSLFEDHSGAAPEPATGCTPDLASAVDGADAVLVAVGMPTRRGKPVLRNIMSMQTGDMLAAWSDMRRLDAPTGSTLEASIRSGVPDLVSCYREHHGG